MRTITNRFARCGQISKGLLVSLVLLMLAAGGVWFFFWHSEKSEKDVIASTEFSLYCSKCKATTMISGADLNKLKGQGNKIECPKCKSFSASLDRTSEVRRIGG